MRAPLCHPINDLDLQLMRRIGLAPFLVWPHPPSSLRPAALARALHVSTDTVKRRLAAMEEAGVYRGTMVFPNPRLVGLETASFHFRAQGAATRRVRPERVLEVSGVLGVFDMVGGDRCVDLAFADTNAREAARSQLSSLFGAPSTHFVDYRTPVPSVSMAAMDWRVLASMRAQPNATPETAAAGLGVSARTVKRRFERMVKGGAVDVIGLFDPGAVKGYLLVDLLFYLREGAGAQELQALLGAFRSRWIAQWSPPDRRLGHLALVVVAESARELEDLRREGESLPFVERCEALIVESALESWGWIDAQVALRASEPTTARPPAPTAPATRGR
jgi:DNA-binding Lrp family transcriptional regulator